MRRFEISGLSVMLAMPCHRDIPVETVISLMATIDTMKNRNIPFELQIQKGGSIIEWARSRCVKVFLESDANRLFWIDSDIVWKANDFMRLLALSTKYPCVGAVYPAKQDDLVFYIRTLGEVLEANDDGLIPMAGIGMGFVVMNRDVLQKLSDKAKALKMPEGEYQPHLFRCDSEDEEFRGEDMAFFNDMRAEGYPLLVDPGVVLGHVGPKVYTASFLDILTKEQEKNDLT